MKERNHPNSDIHLKTKKEVVTNYDTMTPGTEQNPNMSLKPGEGKGSTWKNFSNIARRFLARCILTHTLSDQVTYV